MRLNEVYPWGHTLAEYQAMFSLDDDDLRHSIISFADGTSSANTELTQEGGTMVSVDPIYQFANHDISRRLNEVVNQSKHFREGLSSDEQREAADIANSRASATSGFLADFDLGKKQRRYIVGSLPGPFSLRDNSFNIGLCGHFLLLYDYYGLEFHIEAMTEMLRICKEIRIYPTVNLSGRTSLVLDDVVGHFSGTQKVDIKEVDYGFHGVGNQMLTICKE